MSGRVRNKKLTVHGALVEIQVAERTARVSRLTVHDDAWLAQVAVSLVIVRIYALLAQDADHETWSRAI